MKDLRNVAGNPTQTFPKPNRVVLMPKSNQTANVNRLLIGINTKFQRRAPD